MLPLSDSHVYFNNNLYYNARNTGDVQQRFCRTTARKHFLTFAAVRIWNELPILIKNENVLSSFKRKLFNHILNK